MNSVRLPTGVSAVVFDVGETLVDEIAAWSRQAESVGVTPFTLMGVLGALIGRGEDHRRVWEILGVERPAGPAIVEADLYPDALSCLKTVNDAGLIVGIAGNQPASAERELRRTGFRADFVASSASWGVAKPSPAFFARVVESAGVAASEILYVGDRVDNDIVPARLAGMRTAFVRRGPWGYLHASLPEAELADVTFDTLEQLAEALYASS